MINDLPSGLTKRDLEMAARYAERRANELRREAATSDSPHATESINREAAEHEERARRYRNASGDAPDTITPAPENAEAAMEALREYLLGATPDEARRVLIDLRILELEITGRRANELTTAA